MNGVKIALGGNRNVVNWGALSVPRTPSACAFMLKRRGLASSYFESGGSNGILIECDWELDKSLYTSVMPFKSMLDISAVVTLSSIFPKYLTYATSVVG